MSTRTGCMMVLLAAQFAWVAPSWCMAAGSARGPDSPGVAAIEPEVAEAHARALSALPGIHRARLGGIPIERAERYDIPEDAPLAWRLIGAAAHAVYSNSTQSVIIFDAGVRGESRWTVDLTAPEHREAVADFLDALAEPLGERAGDTPALWRAFSDRVGGWADADDRGTPVSLIDEPPIGCPRVFDAFVRLGVPRAMGGTPPLEQLILHELAHAMQLRDGGSFAMAHMRAWASLAGWRRVDTREPFDGYAGGGFRMENPETLIALLLADDPAKAARIGALYEYHAASPFVNRYARFDPREDFAECVRLFATDPDRLIELSPERFAFINAMGWCAELDAAAPGPMWYDAAEIVERGWSDAIHDAAARLLDPPGDAPAAELLARSAIVRAHAEVLDPARLPSPHAHPGVPGDFPQELIDAIDLAVYTPTINGIEYPPDESSFMAMLLESLLSWHDAREFERGMLELLLLNADERDIVEAIGIIEAAETHDERVDLLLVLVEDANGWTRAPVAVRAAVVDTIAMSTRSRRPLLAARLRLVAALHDPAVDEAGRRAAFDAAMRLAHGQDTPIGDAIELHAALADAARRLHQEHGAAPGPIELAEQIPGGTLGLIRRVEFLIGRIAAIRDARRADEAQQLIDAVRHAIDASPHALLRGYLNGMLREVLPSPAEDQP